MIEKINIPPNYRYERKFTIANSSRSRVLHSIKNHPAFFRSIFYPRQINNIYFDDQKLSFFKNNRIGIAKRKKIRIRWYGDLFGKNLQPKLEYKIKDGLLGDKWIFALPKFIFNPGFNSHSLSRVFSEAALPPSILEDLHPLRATLLNTYHRRYFLSADGKFRITLDESMAYYRFDYPRAHFMAIHSTPNNLILELKYLPNEDKLAHKISEKFPFRMDKSSKYVNGILARKGFR
jgi:VTC domain.